MIAFGGGGIQGALEWVRHVASSLHLANVGFKGLGFVQVRHRHAEATEVVVPKLTLILP